MWRMYRGYTVSGSCNAADSVSCDCAHDEPELTHCVPRHLAVNACLAPIVSVDGKHVITVEGVGSPENPHPIQERLWKLSGSQCGFCTPGAYFNYFSVTETTSNGP
jgi:xanthine dehydrogenase iron-sulfur cluster and FAD-binding subunit A